MSSSPLAGVPESRLQALESVIERGKRTFIEVGEALLEIRDSRLYRQAYTTFEDYCRQRWNWNRRYANRVIEGAEAALELGPTGPATERQVRELVGLPSEKRNEVWQQAVKEHGTQPTSEQIRETRLGVHFSSATDEWSTPQDLFDQLNAEFNFTLDVCASPDNAKCKRFFTRETDGLVQGWDGVCWMNPPYGDVIGDWVAKAHETGKTSVVVCLVPARTDTAWWWDYVRHGEVRFLRGRLKFGGADSSAPFPSAVVIFGKRACVKWWER